MAVYEPLPQPAVEAVEVANARPVVKGGHIRPENFSEYPDWLRAAVESSEVRWRNCHYGLHVSTRAAATHAVKGDFLVFREGRVEHWKRGEFLSSYGRAA